jgi:hypothetical protein
MPNVTSNILYRVHQKFEDGSRTEMTGLTHSDLCVLVGTFDNLPSLILCVILPEAPTDRPVDPRRGPGRDVLGATQAYMEGR